MPGDIFYLPALHLDRLLIEEMQVTDRLPIVCILNGVNVLDDVDLAHGFGVYLRESLLEFPESGILVDFYYQWLLLVQLVTSDTIFHLQTKHLPLYGRKMRPSINKALFFSLSEQLLDEVDVYVQLDLAVTDLAHRGQLCNVLEDLSQELLSKCCSFVGD